MTHDRRTRRAPHEHAAHDADDHGPRIGQIAVAAQFLDEPREQAEHATHVGFVHSLERGAGTLLLTEKIEEIVKLQVEAIKNIKIDKITVWDSAAGNGDGTSTSHFLSGLVKSLPPLHDVAQMAGLELPKFLGDAKAEGSDGAGHAVSAPRT